MPSLTRQISVTYNLDIPRTFLMTSFRMTSHEKSVSLQGSTYLTSHNYKRPTKHWPFYYPSDARQRWVSKQLADSPLCRTNLHKANTLDVPRLGGRPRQPRPRLLAEALLAVMSAWQVPIIVEQPLSTPFTLQTLLLGGNAHCRGPCHNLSRNNEQKKRSLSHFILQHTDCTY